MDTSISFLEPPGAMYDSFGRHLHYLRVSLTDACNLRCVYCMPEDIVFRPPATLLQDDEIVTLVRIAASLGVDKVRLTGGEPTVRRGVVDLVRAIKAIPGIQRIAMTTNGIKLADLAKPLFDAGLTQVNISIDSLKPDRFRRITRRGDLDDVWRGIEAAQNVGMDPIKLNCVVTRGFNEDEVADLAKLTLVNSWEIRFIELMPLGTVAEFQLDQVVPVSETKARIEAELGPLFLESGHNGHDPAQPLSPGRRAGPPGLHQQRYRTLLLRVQSVTSDRRWAAAAVSAARRRGRPDDTATRRGQFRGPARVRWPQPPFRKPWGHRLEENDIARSREMSQIGG